MADFQDPTITVQLDRLNREVDGIVSYSLDAAFLTSTDGFEFQAYDEDRAKLRGLELHPVTLSVNGQTQLEGRIDSTEVGGNGTRKTFRGRDWMGDLVECHVDPVVKLREGQTLKDAILTPAVAVGVYDVISDDDEPLRNIRTGRTIDGKPAAADFKGVKVSEHKVQPGQGMYDWINRLCARFGCAPRAGPRRGVIALSSPTYDQDPSYVLERGLSATGGSYNILQGRAVRDFSSFPTFTLFTGKGAVKGGSNKSRTTFEFGTETLSRVIGGELQELLDGKMHVIRVKPGEVPPDDVLQLTLYRLLYQRDDDAKTQAELERVATRAMAERLKETLIYTCTVRGHEDPRTGHLYAVDTIADVRDEVAEVSERLWVMRRTFKYSRTEGATTEMEMIRPGSLQL